MITKFSTIALAMLAFAGAAANAAVLMPNASPIALVTDTTVNAVAAAGSFVGNDTGNTATIQDTLDTMSFYFGAIVPGGTGGWVLGDKTDSADGDQFYTFTNNPQTPTGTLNFNAPITGWFAITLKSSNNFSMYLFDGGVAGISSIDYSTIGTSVNRRGDPQDLSHASLWGGTAPIPEPGTYALLLAGLGIVGVMARRRKSV